MLINKICFFLPSVAAAFLFGAFLCCVPFVGCCYCWCCFLARSFSGRWIFGVCYLSTEDEFRSFFCCCRFFFFVVVGVFGFWLVQGAHGGWICDAYFSTDIVYETNGDKGLFRPSVWLCMLACDDIVACWLCDCVCVCWLYLFTILFSFLSNSYAKQKKVPCALHYTIYTWASPHSCFYGVKMPFIAYSNSDCFFFFCIFRLLLSVHAI